MSRLVIPGVWFVLAVRLLPAQAAPTNPPLRFVTLWLGNYRTCGVAATGAGYCWGANYFGELGTGSQPQPTPTPRAVAGGMRFVAVEPGELSTCGLTTSGAIDCWGATFFHEFVFDSSLGRPVSKNRAVPTPIPGGMTFVTLSVGSYHACALTAAGAAYCWGANRSGELGTGDTLDPTAPTPVAGGLTFKVVSVGGEFTCGLTTAGAAYCWGSDFKGEIGRAAPQKCGVGLRVPCATTPETVSGGLLFTDISAGSSTTCAIAADSTAYCWGSNEFEQLGVGASKPQSSAKPLPVAGGLRFRTIGVGDYYVCGLATDQRAYCWGWNARGHLGVASPEMSPVPVAVSGGLTWRSLVVGTFHTCGIAMDGATYCWGEGALGNGLPPDMSNSSFTPVRVIDSP
jgi:alpha-tubulin suppressor-like RCC1 family protein